MIIEADSKVLLQNVSIGGSCVDTRSVLPVLTGIKLVAKNGVLLSTSTDLNTGVECTTPVMVYEEGACVVPARAFMDIVKNLPAGKITLEGNEVNVVLKYGDSEMTLNGYSSLEFPELPNEPDKDAVFNIKEGLLKEMLGQVLYAASNEQSRPTFTAIFFEIGETFRMTATDTHRLAYSETQLDKSVAETTCLVPAKALYDLVRILTASSEEEVTVKAKENHITFSIKGGSITLLSRYIEGQYPNYRQVIPQKHKTSVKVSTRLFKETAERASLVNPKRDSCTIKVNIDNDGLSVFTKSEIGKVDEKVSAVVGGEPLTISMNPSYLIDALNAFGGSEVTIYFDGPLTPFYMQKDGRFALVLPVREQ